MLSILAHKVTEKHLALRDNIGTYEEEDKAFELLTWLSWHLPVFVVASALLDLLLAVVYLKWLHPWRILLQEVSSLGFEFRLFNFYISIMPH